MNIYNKKILASLLVLSSVLVLVFAACKTESAAPTSSYTITVEPRGGTGVEASYTVQDGQTVTIPDPKKDNNKFLGWCYTADGNSVDFVSGQTNIDGNKTIYALWQQTSFKVTVDGNGVPLGTYTGGTYNYGDTIPAPTGNALPTKTDYEIAYWSKTKDVYSDHFEFGTSPVISDMTLYPHWRYTTAKIQTMLRGNWLVHSIVHDPGVNYTEKYYYYSIKSGGANSSVCYLTPFPTAILQPTQAIIDIMKAMPVSDPLNISNSATSNLNVNGTTYILNYVKFAADLNVYTVDTSSLHLPDSNNGQAYTRIYCDLGSFRDGSYFVFTEPSLGSYITDNSSDINLNSFVDKIYKANSYILKSYSDTTFVFDEMDSSTLRATYTGTRIP